MSKKRWPVSIIYWQEAFFSFKKRPPMILPPIQVTFGIIISKNKKSINIGLNCEYDKEKEIIKITDGILIPQKTVVKIKQIGYLS